MQMCFLALPTFFLMTRICCDLQKKRSEGHWPARSLHLVRHCFENNNSNNIQTVFHQNKPAPCRASAGQCSFFLWTPLVTCQSFMVSDEEALIYMQIRGGTHQSTNILRLYLSRFFFNFHSQHLTQFTEKCTHCFCYQMAHILIKECAYWIKIVAYSGDR